MHKIPILYITCFGSMQGGGQKSLYLLIKHLDKERFRPFLVVPQAGALKDAVERLGVEVFVLPLGRLRSLNISRTLRGYRTFGRIIDETQAHIVSTDSVRETFYARLACRRRGASVLLHLRVADINRWLDRMLYASSDALIAVSHAAADRFNGMDKESKVTVVYNGVELDSLLPAPPRPPDGRLRIGCFGRLEPRKGIDVLIRAVARLKARPLSIHLFGDGEAAYERHLKRLAAGDDRIHFEGFVEDAADRMRQMDAVVLASRRGEGLSRAVIEAMALARPVIVSDIPSNPELVGSDQEAFIFRNNDDAELARLLDGILKQPDVLIEAGRRARCRAEAFFDLEKNTRRIEEIYDRVAQHKPGRSSGGVPQKAMPLGTFRKILIVNLGGIGDLFLSSAALGALRRHFADARIVFCGVPRTAAFARSLGCFDAVLPFSAYEEGTRRFVGGRLRSFVGMIAALRRERFDLALNMRTLHSRAGAWKMALLFFAVGARRRAGRDTDGRGFFFTIKVPETTRGEKHEIEYDLDTVRALGVPVSGAKPLVLVSEDVRKAVDDFLDRNGITGTDRLVGVNPGGALSHRWPLASFGEALKQLLGRKPAVVVVTGGRGEQGLGEALVGALRGYRVVNAAGRLSWEELGALLERCDLFITNDTGPMHVAAVLKTPLVAIFGPGYLVRFDPRHLSDKAIVLYEKACCAPCDKLSCRDLQCLKRITPQAVVAAGLELLERENNDSGTPS